MVKNDLEDNEAFTPSRYQGGEEEEEEGGGEGGGEQRTTSSDQSNQSHVCDRFYVSIIKKLTRECG